MGTVKAGYFIKLLVTSTLALLLASCSTMPKQEQAAQDATGAPSTSISVTDDRGDAAVAQAADARSQAVQTWRGFLDKGTGVFVNPRAGAREAWQAEPGGDVTLTFEAADLKEMVKVVLGDILGVNYLIDDRVRGQVTLYTNRPVKRESLLPILEAALQANGAALLVTAAGYQVVPLANAARSPVSPAVGASLAAGVGYRLQVVPLRFVSAADLQQVIDPFIPEGVTLKADESRNLLILSGTSRSLAQLIQTIEIFDVDWLKGMSFGLFALENADAKSVAKELDGILGLQTEGLLKGMIRLVPIDRLNALLVISRRPEHLEQAALFIRRLDQGAGGDGRRLHVYSLSHGNAEEIAKVLNQIYGESGNVVVKQAAALTETSLAPMPAVAATEQATTGEGAKSPAPRQRAPRNDSSPVETSSAIAIYADVANNALLVLATPEEYSAIEAAVRKLDIARRQVLVEATIAEVTLTDNLQYGLQWFMRGTLGDYRSTGTFTSTESSTLSSAVAPGFSYSLTDTAGVVRLLFDALASESKLKVLSSPQVLVMDNETASIRVGDQIPIVTRSSSSVSDPDAPIVNEVQYRDTGVLLRVTPHINAGGMVSLEINQEVSEASSDAFASGNVSILQRTVESSVAVQSGETVVLGGLIRESKTNTVTGIPVLSKIPLLGKLFSRTVDGKTRTELVITITPRVLNSPKQTREASEELIRRMKGLEALETNLLAPYPAANRANE